MTDTSFIDQQFDEHLAVANAMRQTIAPDFAELVDAGLSTVRAGGKILFFGNGGSAADAQHLATELVVRYVKDRPAIASLALTTDTSAITAGSNDIGFDQIFARQIEALGRKEDMAIGISTSGTSANVLAGLDAARKIGMRTAGFSGESGGKMAPLCDVLIKAPHRVSNRIQEMHILIGHAFCGALEQQLGLVDG